jgi:hypothetical protein
MKERSNEGIQKCVLMEGIHQERIDLSSNTLSNSLLTTHCKLNKVVCSIA